MRTAAILAGIITLSTALVTGLTYVSAAFASVMPDGVANWHATASALAVEVGVIFAGLVLALKTREGDVPWRLYVGVGLFLVVSMYANGDAVLRTMLGEAPTLPAVAALDGWSQARAMLLGSAVPLMVLVALESLRELATTKAPSQPYPAERLQVDRVSDALEDAMHDAPALPRRQPTTSADDLVDLVSSDPEITVADAARELEVSRGTIYSWAKRSGLERNGDGRWHTA